MNILFAMADSFAQRCSDVASGEWNFFGRQTYNLVGHATVTGHKEGEDGWYQRVGQYWVEGVDSHGIDGRNHGWPWSAAFISWVMRKAGAGMRFRYSSQHSVYISQSIRDRLQNRQAAGYWGWRLNELKPTVGDLICWSRQAGVDYDHQQSGNYNGHTDLIVQVGSQVQVIGGNVGDSVSNRVLALDAEGFLKPVTQGGEILFALMQNRISE